MQPSSEKRIADGTSIMAVRIIAHAGQQQSSALVVHVLNTLYAMLRNMSLKAAARQLDVGEHVARRGNIARDAEKISASAGEEIIAIEHEGVARGCREEREARRHAKAHFSVIFAILAPSL